MNHTACETQRIFKQNASPEDEEEENGRGAGENHDLTHHLSRTGPRSSTFPRIADNIPGGCGETLNKVLSEPALVPKNWLSGDRDAKSPFNGELLCVSALELGGANLVKFEKGAVDEPFASG